LRGGGGGNFGIVTRFVFRTHPVGNVVTYSASWPWADAKRVVDAWQKLAPTAPDGLFSVLNVNAAAGSSANPNITSAGQFYGAEERLRTILQPLVSTGTPLHFTTSTRTYLSAALMWAGCGSLPVCHLPPQGDRGRATFAAKSSFSNSRLSSAGIDALLRQIEERRSTGSGSGIVLLDSWGGAINRVPKGRTAFVHRDALFSMQYLAYWDTAAPAAPNVAMRRCAHTSRRSRTRTTSIPISRAGRTRTTAPTCLACSAPSGSTTRRTSSTRDRASGSVGERQRRGHERPLPGRADDEQRPARCLRAVA